MEGLMFFTSKFNCIKKHNTLTQLKNHTSNVKINHIEKHRVAQRDVKQCLLARVVLLLVDYGTLNISDLR